MVFKEPTTSAEARARIKQRDALIEAATVLDACNVEPDVAGKLKRLAGQMNTAIVAWQRHRRDGRHQ